MLKLMAVKPERLDKNEPVLHFAKYNRQKYLVKSKGLGTGRITKVVGKEIRCADFRKILDSELADERRGEKAAVIRILRRPPSLIFSKDSELPKPDSLEYSLWNMALGAPSEKGLRFALLLAPSDYFYSVLAAPEKKISSEIIKCRMAAPPAHVFLEESRLHISMIL